MSTKSSPPASPSPGRPGRPRLFDETEALDRALEVFWSKGYEGTTLTDLTDAIGVNRPSLYATFGNKEELFRRACARYLEFTAPFGPPAETDLSPREAVRRSLVAAARAVVHPEHPGCLLVTAALATGDDARVLSQELGQARARTREAWATWFKRAGLKNAGTLARYVTTVSHGLSVHARGGATAAELVAVAELAASTIPEDTTRASGSST